MALTWFNEERGQDLMSDNNYRPEGDPLARDVSHVPGTDDLLAVGSTGSVTMVDGDESDDERDFVPPKGRVGAAITLGLSQSIDNSEGGVSKTFFPQIMAAFQLTNTELGLLNALGHGARMIFGPLWAMVADKFGRKAVLFIVTGLWGLWTIGAAFAPSWEVLLIIYGISLVGTVAAEPILNGLLGSLYKRSERGKAFGTVRGVSAGLGFIMTPLLGQFGANPEGWRWAFVTMGCLSLLSGILILFFVHDPKNVDSDDREDMKSDAGMFKLSDAGKLFKIPTLALMAPMLLLVTSLVLFGFQGQVWAVDLGYGVVNSSYLYTVMQIGMFISAFLGGWLGDRFQKWFGDKGRIIFFQVYAVSFGTIIALTMYFAHWWDSDVSPLADPKAPPTNDPSFMYYVMVFLMGLIFSWGFSGCVLPMVSSVAPVQLSATAFALLFSFVQGGINVIYSFGVGIVATAIGSLPTTILWGAAVPYFLNAIFWFVFYKTYPKDVAKQAERSHLMAQGKF